MGSGRDTGGAVGGERGWRAKDSIGVGSKNLVCASYLDSCKIKPSLNSDIDGVRLTWSDRERLSANINLKGRPCLRKVILAVLEGLLRPLEEMV